MFSSKSPRELLASELQRRKSVSFVYDSENASEVFFGRVVELRAPKGDMSFRVRTLQNVRAQSVVLEVLPEALPAGLVPFSPVVQLVHAPLDASGNVAISASVPEAAVAPEGFGELKLYAHDEAEGWFALKGQRSNADGHMLTGIDLAVRTYVVLGPKSARR